MAADIYGDGQTRYVCGARFDVYGKGGAVSPEALGSDIELVYFEQHAIFKVRVKAVRISLAYISAQCLF